MDTKDIKFNTHRVDAPNEAGFSRVSLDKQLFLDIAKYNTPYPYTTSTSKNGKVIKIFKIGDFRVITAEVEIEGTHTDKKGKEYNNTETLCFMNQKDALSIQTNIEDEQKEFDITV